MFNVLAFINLVMFNVLTVINLITFNMLTYFNFCCSKLRNVKMHTWHNSFCFVCFCCIITIFYFPSPIYRKIIFVALSPYFTFHLQYKEKYFLNSFGVYVCACVARNVTGYFRWPGKPLVTSGSKSWYDIYWCIAVHLQSKCTQLKLLMLLVILTQKLQSQCR